MPFLRPIRWRFLRALAAAVPGVVLAACVSVPVPKLPQDDLPAHWQHVEAAQRLGPAPDLTGWWKRFGDPELDALVDRALADNLEVAQAALKLRAARALEDASSARFKPQLAFNTLEQPNAENSASYFQAGFDASWEFGLFGRLGASRHLTDANTGIAEAELQGARVSLVAEVASQYLQLRGAQRTAALLQQAGAASDRKARLVAVRARLQLASRLAATRAAAAAAAQVGGLAAAQAAVVQHAEALAVLLGRSEPDPAWLVPKAPPTLAVGNVDSVPANLLRTRPEIRYAEMQVLQAAGELGVAKADLYPRLALGSSVTFAALVTGHTHLGDVNSSFAIGPIINIPLFDWGRRHAVYGARGDQLQAALLAYRQAVLKGAGEVETDLAALNASAQRLRGADAALAASQAGVTATDTLAGLGQADGLQLADARAARTDAELGREQARLAHGLAFISLYKALGGAPLPQADAALPRVGGAPQVAPDASAIAGAGAAVDSAPVASRAGVRAAGER